MKVLVTGATGFFGSEIVARLSTAGHAVTGAARRAGTGEVRALDITSLESCLAVVRAVAPDAVVHAAALAHVHPGRMSEDLCRVTNIEGVEHMLDASIRAGVKRFVFISSVMVYGDYGLPPVVRETDPVRQHGVYGESKVRAEQACRARAHEIEVVILRMASMYSPDWLANVRKRVRPRPSGPPVYFSLDARTPRYSLCSRRNGAEAVLWSVDGRLMPGTYNVADRETYSQADIRRAVEAADGPGLTVLIPVLLPRLMNLAVQTFVPMRRWRENARSRYWKFCKPNVYSSEKLNNAGLDTPADLLELGSRS